MSVFFLQIRQILNRLKMDAIAKSSGALDEVLQDKRTQVRSARKEFLLEIGFYHFFCLGRQAGSCSKASLAFGIFERTAGAPSRDD